MDADDGGDGAWGWGKDEVPWTIYGEGGYISDKFCSVLLVVVVGRSGEGDLEPGNGIREGITGSMEINIDIICVFLGGAGGGCSEANFGSVVVVFSFVVVGEGIFNFVGERLIVFVGGGTASVGVSTT